MDTRRVVRLVLLVIAAVCFGLAFFGEGIGDRSAEAAGLFFVALALAVESV